ncbi:hypothetical protein NA57DRAFT_68658 [Rhizodiscina lignyota]|uniref:Cyclase n=1 Tax=Rhizodiscina lignyota TaxID=1504668 RepID=A0A9P4M5P3_9PEZI|nr:hypothetical protein NA57DRAFT_68658 [Rhizodiscina lignyota]
MSSSTHPPFSALPLRKSDPYYSAWGLYGPNDELGTLNHLKDDIVASAASEIRSGHRISLNWALNALDGKSVVPFFKRQTFHLNIYARDPPRIGIDDVWTFNSQSSSQWDGLRHAGYHKERLFYNGVTEEQILGEGAGSVNGIHNMAKRGIVGRGVLLDFHRWRLETKPAKFADFDPFKGIGISAQDLHEVAKFQGIEFQPGDILLYRAGLFEKFEALSSEQKMSITTDTDWKFAGLEQSEEMLKFLWENRFACVGSDQPAVECFPKQGGPFSLHEVLLAGWGMPLGEFFHLEELASHCKEMGRYTFFLVSEPCNVIGGAASPPNVLAIF